MKARSTLTTQQAKKVKAAVAGLYLVKGEQPVTVYRFADAYARFRLGTRPTAPTAHTGLTPEQRKVIREKVNTALGIKEKPKAVAKKSAAKKSTAKGKGKAAAKSAAPVEPAAKPTIAPGVEPEDLV